jgi:hypothetical protein
MLAEKKAEMNARKRGNCHRKKAERQAASISMETTGKIRSLGYHVLKLQFLCVVMLIQNVLPIGVASITNQTNVCAVVVDTSGIYHYQKLYYILKFQFLCMMMLTQNVLPIGVASVVNQPNGSNIVVDTLGINL